VRGWLGDNDEMPNDEMPNHARAVLSPSPPDMCLKSKSDGACLVWFSIHGLGVGDSHLPQFGWAIEPQMRFFGRNGCSDLFYNIIRRVSANEIFGSTEDYNLLG
jgi:hypothetical protein